MNNSTYNHFLKQLIGLAIGIGILVGAIYFKLFPAFLIKIPIVILFFTAFTALEHFILYKSVRLGAKFIGHYMGAFALKFFVYIIITAIFLYFFRADKYPFVILLGIIYISYTVFETIAILKHVKAVEEETKSKDE